MLSFGYFLMPRRYRKSYGRKRTYKRRPRRYARRVTRQARRWPRGIGPPAANSFPKKILVKLKMSAYLNETLANTDIVMKLNDLYDAMDVHGTSQPAGYDHWKVIYGKYRVLKTNFSVVYINEATSVNVYAYIMVNKSGSSYSSYAHDDMMSLPYAQYCVLMPSTSGLNKSKKVVKVRPSTIIGDDSAREETPVGNSPTDAIYVHLMTNGNSSTSMLVHWTWYVEFTEPQDVIDT